MQQGNHVAPEWIDTVQHAELYAALFALRLGCYMHLPYVVVATDSDVTRSQILGMKGENYLRSQQCMLR